MPFRKRISKKYWGAFKALYGSKNDVVISGEGVEHKNVATGKKKPSPSIPTEQHEQFRLVHWMKQKEIWHYHVPNGGYRDPREAAKFQRLGVSPGVPDICIPIPAGGLHGFYVELKRINGGRLSENQIRWRDFLMSQGYGWVEARGCDMAVEMIEDYLGGIK